MIKETITQRIERGYPILIPEDKHKIVCQQRRTREKNQRIQSILEAAQRVFFSKGYLKSTMDEIALEAEVTKPTVYLYFKAKDDLFFTLMLPLMEDIQKQLEKAEESLATGKIKDGGSLIKAIFRAFYHGYQTSPETFGIIQLFQQQRLMSELKPEIRTALNDKGRINFILGRRLLTRGIELGLIKKVNVYEMADVIWSLIVGVIQLEDIKSDEQKGHRLKKNTLRLAEQLIAEALTIHAGKQKRKRTLDKAS
jgi:TetR/AcrR family transcriptional regulator